MTFGEKFKVLMLQHKMRQGDFEFVGAKKSTVYRWAKGEAWPSLKQLQSLAEHFGVPAAYLADDCIETVERARSREMSDEERQYVEMGRALGMKDAALLMTLIRKMIQDERMPFMEVARRLLKEESGASQSPGNPGHDRGPADLRVHARGEGGAKSGADHQPKSRRH